MMYDNFSDTWITTQIAHSGRQQAAGGPPTPAGPEPLPSPQQAGEPEHPAVPAAAGRRMLLTPLQEDDVRVGEGRGCKRGSIRRD